MPCLLSRITLFLITQNGLVKARSLRWTSTISAPIGRAEGAHHGQVRQLVGKRVAHPGRSSFLRSSLEKFLFRTTAAHIMTGALLVIAGTARNSIIHRDMMCIAQGTSRQLGTDEPPPIDLESRDRSSDRLKNIPGRLFDGRDTRSHWLLGLSPQDFFGRWRTRAACTVHCICRSGLLSASRTLCRLSSAR
jgi:hypothetical protein